MNPKIDDAPLHAEGNTNNLSTGFITSFLFTTLVALAVIYLWDLAGQGRTSHVPRFFVVPWVLAAGQELENGMNEFSGRSLQPVSTLLRFTALGGMFVIVILGPTFFLLGMRKRAIAHQSSRLSWPHSTGSIVGAVITIPIVCIILLGPPIQKVAFSNLKERQAVQSGRDFMINDLNRIAWDVFQYRVKPKSMGRSGGGSVAGYALSPDLETTPFAHYSVSLKEGKVEVLASSTRYPGATITTTVNETGALSNWRFEGEFRDEAPPPGFWTSLKRLLLSY